MKAYCKHLALLLTLLLYTIAGGCRPASLPDSPPVSSASSADTIASFDAFLEHFFRTELTANTLNLHFTLSDPQQYGIKETPITLGSLSAQAQNESRAALENTRAVLSSFDYSRLSARQQLDYDVLSAYMDTLHTASNLTLYDEILRPSTGIQAQLPVLYEEYRFQDKNDIDEYLSLISLTDRYFEEIIAFEQQKADAGLFMSDYACDTIISQCETFIKNPDEHYLIVTFEHKLDQMPELTEAEREAYCEKNKRLVKTHILPAYESLAQALTGLLGSGTNEQGLCNFPDGREYYTYLVAYNTGSSKTVRDIQEMVAAQRNRDLSAAAALLGQSPTLAAQCDNTRIESMDSVATLEHLQREMLAQFPAAPETEFTVRYIDACMEDYMAPAFYITAPLDNYKNNSIFINAATDTTTMRYFTTLAHEGFPGHLYQTVMSYEAGLSPARAMLNFPGYVEGWATYVEMLSYQYAGLDKHVAALMALNQSALLSLYASTDLGIHYDGWSFEEMLAFWEDYGISDSDALREVYELIVEEPAHYLKYYVGYLEFLELKEKAKETYGSSYSDTAFHRAVLHIGPAPFSIVEKYLDDYYYTESRACLR